MRWHSQRMMSSFWINYDHRISYDEVQSRVASTAEDQLISDFVPSVQPSCWRLVIMVLWSGFRHGLFSGWRFWSWLDLDYTDLCAISLTSLKTVHSYFSWQSLLFVDIVCMEIDDRSIAWWVLELVCSWSCSCFLIFGRIRNWSVLGCRTW